MCMYPARVLGLQRRDACLEFQAGGFKHFSRSVLLLSPGARVSDNAATVLFTVLSPLHGLCFHIVCLQPILVWMCNPVLSAVAQ